MTDLCSCAMSIMGAGQARSGWLNCEVCGGAWFSPSRSPYKLDPDSATRIREFIAAGGLVAGVWALGQVVFVPPEDVVAPPGKAHLVRCPDCSYAASKGRACDCEGTGVQLYHACIACGDIAMWVYGLTGRDGDYAHMSCRLCGARWDQGHPEWIAQRIPARIAADAAG